MNLQPAVVQYGFENALRFADIVWICAAVHFSQLSEIGSMVSSAALWREKELSFSVTPLEQE